jgi:myosin heavy subunit
MSAHTYRSQLEAKAKARVNAEKKAGELRTKEAGKRADATKARAAAARTTSATSANSKLREAARHEDQANAAGREAAQWSTKAAKHSKEESELQVKLAKAEESERQAAERKRKREQAEADRRAAQEQQRFQHEQAAAARRAALEQEHLRQRLTATETRVRMVVRELRAPKPEKLRVLMLGASSEGDLRVGREQSRIRTAVERALHRDLVELDVRTAATATDLLDGITRFRPHVVHFSGHSAEDLIVFEKDIDELHEGAIVTARAFGRAVTATDDPPLLVLLNSCHSAAQIDKLVDKIPFAIGMTDEIGDAEAIIYASQFYAAVANGQSVASAHAVGQVAVEMAGLPDHEVPALAHAADVDPAATFLVKPPQ